MGLLHCNHNAHGQWLVLDMKILITSTLMSTFKNDISIVQFNLVNWATSGE